MVTSTVASKLQYPEFSADNHYGGLLSAPAIPSASTPYTFFQSPSLMNISGRPITKAWSAFRSSLTAEERARAMLVIVHDELEKRLGQVRVRTTGTHGGHNGIRSCIEHLRGKNFVRVGVGISRPESRMARTVAAYVLGELRGEEREMVLMMSVPKVMRELEELARKQ